MSRLEDELRSALRRREPSADFAERVMARVPKARAWVRPWLAGAAAAAFVVVGGAGYQYKKIENQRLESERVRAELVYALGLTAQKLEFTKSKVLKHTRDEI